MIKFLKSALVNGLAMLLPVVLVFLAIKEIFALLVNIATPIADLFPPGTFDHVKETEILAVLLIVGLAIFLGILSKLKAGRVLGHSIEKLVNRECVHYLDVTLDEFSLSLTHLGTGMSELLPEENEILRKE